MNQPQERSTQPMRAAVRRALLGGCLMLGLPAHAAITFQFEYTDAPGTGFFDDTYGANRQAVLNKAASEFSSMFGSIFSNSGTILLEAKMEYEPGTLASAGSNYELEMDMSGYKLSDIVRIKLTEGKDLNGASPDGTLAVNFGADTPWETDFNTPPRPEDWWWGDPGTYDFYGTLYHEFTHLLGFSPAMRADGTTLYNSMAYNEFAGFLVDGYGNYIIDAHTNTLNQNIWNAASIGYSMDGSDNGLFFAGQAATAANGGDPVALYSPGEWNPGSSASHLDPYVDGQGGMMIPALETGRSVREYSDIEVAILTDLGYSVAVVPEPETWSMMLAGLALLGSIARRRRQWALPA